MAGGSSQIGDGKPDVFDIVNIKSVSFPYEVGPETSVWTVRIVSYGNELGSLTIIHRPYHGVDGLMIQSVVDGKRKESLLLTPPKYVPPDESMPEPVVLAVFHLGSYFIPTVEADDSIGFSFVVVKDSLDSGESLEGMVVQTTIAKLGSNA